MQRDIVLTEDYGHTLRVSEYGPPFGAPYYGIHAIPSDEGRRVTVLHLSCDQARHVLRALQFLLADDRLRRDAGGMNESGGG
jgi:hypothetical protein